MDINKSNNKTSKITNIKEVTITPDKHDVIMDEVNNSGVAVAAAAEPVQDGKEDNNKKDIENNNNIVVEGGGGGMDINNGGAGGDTDSNKNGELLNCGDKDDELTTKKSNPLDILTEAMDMKVEAAAKKSEEEDEEKVKADDESTDEMKIDEAAPAEDTGDKSNAVDSSGDDNNNKSKPPEAMDESGDGDSDSGDKNKESKDDKGEEPTTSQQEAADTDNNIKEDNNDAGESASSTDNNNTDDKKPSSEEKKKEDNNNNTEEDEKKPDTPAVNLPILTGTLAYSDRDNLRRHIIRGNWKYESSHAVPPQRFELLRTIPPDEDLKELPKDGEFNGSFNVQVSVKTSKGKIKLKSRSVSESGVKLSFKPKDDDTIEGGAAFAVHGTGTNEYGVFELFGTATKNTDVEEGEDTTYSISVHKKYIAPVPAPPASATTKADKKRKHGDGSTTGSDGPKPPPTILPTEGICLRGKLVRNTSDELSLDNAAVHRITGLWAMKGLSKIVEDPDQCEKFEYEHKCSGESTVFPLSGRYTGFFYVSEVPGERTKVPERDVTLKFILNSDGYHNVEGRGSNIYGKYSITGTFDKDGQVTLFRLFQAPKVKTNKKSSTSVKISAPNGGANGRTKLPKAAAPAAFEAPLSSVLTFDDVNGSKDDEVPPPLNPPVQFTAVSRGILKIENDGTHTCSGSWAMSNEHFQQGLTSKYHFGIAAHDAIEDAKSMLDRMKESGQDKDDDRRIKNLGGGGAPESLANSAFPIDSTHCKGSFKMRKGTTRTTTIVDQQIVLKYVKNSGGSYNVYGKGQNEMGLFDLVGTLILQGKANGLMQLYRLYPQAPIPAPVVKSKSKSSFQGGLTEKATPANSGPAPAMNAPERFIPSMSGLQRRESSRMSRLPSRLEEDDPQAQMDRCMDRCRQIIKELQDADIQKIFGAPVDPIALGIPTYFDVIKDPMDLGTIQTKMDNNEIDSPDEFARLVRLTFQNAINFNSLPDNIVHVTARGLLVLFNKKFGSIDKTFNDAKKNRKLSKAERQELSRKEKEASKEAKRKAKKEKERKRKAEEEASNESKRMKLEHVLAANKATMDAIAKAAPSKTNANVTRSEYNLLVQAVKQVQDQIASLHKLVKKSSSKSSSAQDDASTYAPSYSAADAYSVESSKPKKKKAKKEVEYESPTPPSPAYPTQAPVEEDLQPLSFDEQEALSESINLLPERLLPGAMQIIRESEIVNDDDDEIDLDIDQLDTKTQRKLQKFVMQNVKTKKKKKQSKKTKAPPAPAPPSPQVEEEANPSSSSQLPGGKSFFALGDDDSDDAMDEDDDLKADDLGLNWVTNPAQDASTDDKPAGNGENDDDEDDLWGAARKEAETSNAQEADRAKREEKMRAEAEVAAQKRMAEAQELGVQARAKREEQEAEDARLQEDQEREAEESRKAAREEAIKEVNDQEQTVDLDATRDLMRQYEQEFNDNYSAGASPSSDFGF